MSDPRDIIDNSRMTALQWTVIILTVLMNAMDGFDVLAISVAAPTIRAEFGLASDGLGWVLSAELIGMAVGSLLLGGVSDKMGRRNMMLGCLMVMSVGMYLASTANGVLIFCLWRVITGLGIGGMLSSINATAAEFSNKKNRAFCIALMVIGYPLGGVALSLYGKTVFSNDPDNWQAIFIVGAAVSAIMIPLVYFLVPESVHWLTRRQPNNALERVNSSLSKLKQSTVSALPSISDETRNQSVLAIFSPGLLRATVLVTAAYFFTITSFYFVIKWIPDIVGTMGFPRSEASGILMMASLGGAIGGAVFGFLTVALGLKRLTIIVLVLGTVGTALFGRSESDLTQLGFLAALAGFFINAGISGLYAIVARVYPTSLRATGTGFVIGVGRFGSIVGPVLAGYLFQAEMKLPIVAIILGLGTAIAGVLLLFLTLSDGDSDDAESEKA